MELKQETMVIVALVVIAFGVSMYYTQMTNSRLDSIADEISYVSETMEQGLAYISEELGLDVIKGAMEEGQIVIWYTAPTFLMDDILDEFSRTYPFLEIVAQRFSSGPLVTKYESEYAAGKLSVDVIEHARYVDWPRWASENMLFKYDSKEYINYPDWAKVESYFTAYRLYPNIMVVNTEYVDPLTIEGQMSILGDEYKGKIVMEDPRTSGGHLLWYYQTRESLGDEWVEQFFAQDPVFLESSTPAMLALASGEYWINPSCSISTTVNIIKSTGAPLELIFPDNGASKSLNAIGIAKDPAHPNAAKLFFDFILAKEGQEIMRLNNYYPVRLGMPGPAGLPTLSEVYLYPFPDYDVYNTLTESLITEIDDYMINK